jgi:hypothetical protein
MPGWCAIVNSDIVIKNMPIIEVQLSNNRAFAAMSKRYEFEGENFKSAKVVDLGLDFFAAQPAVWREALRIIPAQYRIGHCLWDTWMLGFLCENYFKGLWDITSCRAVFHPRHGDRRTFFDIDKRTGQEQLEKVQWPVNRLKIV